MRTLNFGTQNFTKVICKDDPSHGGACHEYEIQMSGGVNLPLADIEFQKGPVNENQLNGIFMEDLLVICIDRLLHFQAGEYSCRENALALTKIQEAMHWLRHRTECRQKRGVEGTSQK